jgi:orotidine-5'-phosphate decarboxylase
LAPFWEKLQQAMEASCSLLCIGLDIFPERLPGELLAEPDGLFLFNRAIVEATHDLVCAYKPIRRWGGGFGSSCGAL